MGAGKTVYTIRAYSHKHDPMTEMNSVIFFIYLFIYLLQLGCHLVAVVILHVYKI